MGASSLCIAQSDTLALGNGEGLFSEHAQAELALLISGNWCDIMSERHDIHGALTVLNAALPLQLGAEDGEQMPWKFHCGYPQDGTLPNLRLVGLKDFAAAGKVMGALNAVCITTEQRTAGPDTDRQPIVMVQSLKRIRRIIGSDLGEQTKTALAAMAQPEKRTGVFGGLFSKWRGHKSDSRPG
jgi:hypothetical protein